MNWSEFNYKQHLEKRAKLSSLSEHYALDLSLYLTDPDTELHIGSDTENRDKLVISDHRGFIKAIESVISEHCHIKESEQK